MKNGIAARPSVLRVAISLLACLCLALPAMAQTSPTSNTELKLMSPSDHDTFGWAVAISGNTMVIGGQGGDAAPIGATPTGLQFDTGVAYVYERISGKWTLTAKLFGDDLTGINAPIDEGGRGTPDLFGSSVAISGDTIAVGAPQHTHAGGLTNAGAVYVFQKVNGVWQQQAELRSPTPSNSGEFGIDQTLGISGNTIVVGDFGNSLNGFTAGVDVFTRTNGVWQNTATLQVPDDFGFLVASVAIDGNTVVAGSTNSDGNGVFDAGAAYVFTNKNGAWTQQAVLAASDASSGGLFGWSVSVKGSLIAVGALFQPGNTFFSGAAYAFTGDEGIWTQSAKLTANDTGDFDGFGSSVSVSGDTVLVGAQAHSSGLNFGDGSAYVYENEMGQWKQVATLSASDAMSGGFFGQSVAIQNGTILIGAPGQIPGVGAFNYSAGESYVYQLKD